MTQHVPNETFVRELTGCQQSLFSYILTLLPDPDDIGVPVLTARFPRAFVDVNRAPSEIDPVMFTTPPAQTARSQSTRVTAGFGVIPKLAAAGRPIYARRLSGHEGQSRLSMCYEPYHVALKGLIGECMELFGIAIVVDWHSMPSVGASGQELADVVLGNRYGASCDRSVCGAWEEALTENGLGVRRNTPYAGGYVTTTYGQPSDGIHVLQVELNRGLYLDEVRTLRVGPRFRQLKERLRLAINRVISAEAAPMRQAAE